MKTDFELKRIVSAQYRAGFNDARPAQNLPGVRCRWHARRIRLGPKVGARCGVTVRHPGGANPKRAFGDWLADGFVPRNGKAA